jgi:N-acetylglucosaminyldiphosphoundecaprenol N-acetyl-beta-D-mannosaminyltransferase
MLVSIDGEYTGDPQRLPPQCADVSEAAVTVVELDDAAVVTVPPPRRVRVLGTSVSVSTFEGALDYLAHLVRQRSPAYMSCANAFSVTRAQDDPDYQDTINRAAYVAADGMSVVWALRCLGAAADRVHGDDLFLACCERFTGWRHFLVGGRDGQPDAVAAELRRRFPGIEICGTWATPTRPVSLVENARILRAIRATRPSVVWVGMGTPAQDEWMAKACARARVPMVGVGSLFDLLSGRTRPAPGWVKRGGLQWCFRMIQEPRRLGMRYLSCNPRFAAGFAVQLARQAAGRFRRPAAGATANE